MTKPTEPVIEGRPVTSDLALTPEAIESAPATAIPRPTIGQMISLLAGLLLIVCFFLPWANLLVVNFSGFELATSAQTRAVIPTLPILWLLPATAIGLIVLTLGKRQFGVTERLVSIASVSLGILNVAVILYHVIAAQSVVSLLFGTYASLLCSFFLAVGGVIDLVYRPAEEPSAEFKISTEVLRAYTMLFALVAIWIYFHFSTSRIFLDPRNFSNLMRQTSVTGVLAVGMLMVIITAQIDLSVGSLVGLAGGIAAIAQGWYGYGLIPSLAAGVSVAIAIGALQGSLTAYLNIPAFIVTLGGLLAWRGVVLGLSKGETIPLRLQSFKAIGQNYVDRRAGWILAGLAIAAVVWMMIARNRARRRHGLAVPTLGSTAVRIALPSAVILWFIYTMNTYEGVPIPVIILIAIALAGAFLTQNTTFGRYLYAIGGNPDAARLSGINIRKHILAVFCIMGALAGVASIIYTARVGSASPDAGQLLELDAIAACVIGGTSLMGGRGTVFGAILGALIMASLDNGMSLMRVEPYSQMIIKGAILVAAVGLDMAGRKRG